VTACAPRCDPHLSPAYGRPVTIQTAYLLLSPRVCFSLFFSSSAFFFSLSSALSPLARARISLRARCREKDPSDVRAGSTRRRSIRESILGGVESAACHLCLANRQISVASADVRLVARTEIKHAEIAPTDSGS